MSDTSFEEQPDETLIRINELCNRFERTWKSEGYLSIETLLDEVDIRDRPLLAAELIGLEFEFLADIGKDIQVDDYVRRFPFVDPQLIFAAAKCETVSRHAPVVLDSDAFASQRIGEYTLQEQIGCGGMGTVYKAVHRRMRREVAVKLLRPEYTHNPRFLARFSREVRAAAKLSHPNIVTAFDAGEFCGTPYLVSEYIDAQNLADFVRESGPLPVRETMDVILQVACGLQYIHSKGIIHRDIKPANLLLDEAGCVKILDVGLSRLRQPDGEQHTGHGSPENARHHLADTSPQIDLSGSGMMMGTISCMPPEQARDSRDADERSDLYSLGCTMYFLLAGRYCYDGETALDQILAHRSQPIPALESRQSAIPKSLNLIFRRMLAKQPDDRYATASELIADIQTCEAGENIADPVRKTARIPLVTDATDSVRLPYSAAAIRFTRRHYLSILATGLTVCLLVAAGRHFSRNDASNQEESGYAAVTPNVADEVESNGAPSIASAPFDAATATTQQLAWAAWLGVEARIHDDRTGADLVLIPPGEFQMGSSEQEVSSILLEFAHELPNNAEIDLVAGETPIRRVTISRPFYMARTEVTIGQFRRFTDATGYITDAEKNDLGYGLRNGEWIRNEGEYFSWQDIGDANELLTDLHPVGNVSWNDAVAYCHWCCQDSFVYRLPTEAEWEYACRAGTETRWNWGSHTVAMHEYANIAASGGNLKRPFSAPVGARRPNSFGLHDMHGNLPEFCRDWFSTDSYTQGGPTTDPAGPGHRTPSSERFGNTRVCRGGGAADTLVTTRSASRAAVVPEDPGAPTCTIRLLREIPVKSNLHAAASADR